VPLHPTFPCHPANGLTSAVIDNCLRIFLGQAARPFLKSLPGKVIGFGVGVLERSAKFRTPATIKFVADSLDDELAPVLLPPVNVSEEIIGKGHGHTLDGQFILLV
jgi:hypothetical protein